LVKSYANLGLLDKAIEWGAKLVSVDPSPDNYLLFSTILMEMKDFEKAGSNLKKLLYLDPDHVMAHLFLGNLMCRLGKESIGKKHLQNVIELLEPMHEKDIIPGSDGMTAARIKEMAYRILH
jgi:chemotaxis protein methyltransferase CheR